MCPFVAWVVGVRCVIWLRGDEYMILGGDWQELEGNRWPIPSFCVMRTISASGEKKFDIVMPCQRYRNAWRKSR